MQNLLRTKLYIPQMPPSVITRPHLVEQLNLALAGKLSLVTAPAGYGKTTLVTTWLHQLMSQENSPQVVWLSLDEGDKEIGRFLAYFVTAVCELDESFAAIKEALLQDLGDEISSDSIITSLLNEVAQYGQSAIMILDDYHEITESTIHEALSFWLDHQPPNFHLVITSRAQPPLPLPRMRVRRQMTEIETEALRFSRAESADFLNQHMCLNLSVNDIAQLDSITEGWVASLQLAALSLKNNDDPQAFIQAFNGDNHYIVDYLVTEVLEQLPRHICDFLLKTSILERLSDQLCNAVTEQDDSQRILEELDQMRLFVIPLDDRRQWYRYHHLFAECLQGAFQRTTPDEIALCHERASRWFSDNGFLAEAIHHAFAADNQAWAADLIAANVRAVLSQQGEPQRLWQWIQQLPEEAIQTRPYLLIAIAWLKLELFPDQDQQIDALLEDAATLVHAANAPYTAPEIANMATEITLAKAALAYARGDLVQAIQYNEQALTLIQAGDSSILKIGARGSLAINYLLAGNIVQFLDHSTSQLEAIEREQGKPIYYARYVFMSYIMDALRLHGQLIRAVHLYQRIEPYMPQQQNTGSATLLISWAEILRERNQFDDAIACLMPALDVLKPLQTKAAIVQMGTITLARIFQAQGNGTEALKQLADARRVTQVPDTASPFARIPATEARIQLQRGNIIAAKAWLEKSDLQADDDPIYLLEIDYLVMARVLIADGKAHLAQALLQKLEQSATEGGRIARLVEVYILQALAHQALEARQAAVDRLEQALDLSHQEGFVRVFVDEGPALVPLLKQVARRGVAVAHIQQLLPLFEDHTYPQTTSAIDEQSTARQTSAEVEKPPLNLSLNPLTERELATLRYLASNLTIPQIAEQMVVAPSTIRTYIKRIYSKLDVHSRNEAVHCARALALFD